MSKILLASAVLLAAASAGEASTSGIPGRPLDPRITRCGIAVGGEGMATFRPFIETPHADLAGTFRLDLTKTSAGGASTMRQAGGFSGGSLGNIRLAVDRPSAVVLHLTVADAAGLPLCSIDTALDI